MKLVELLARELDVWPSDREIITQDSSGRVYAWTGEPEANENANWYSPDNEDCRMKNVDFDHAKIARDQSTAIITRADWQAERARIAKAAEAKWILHRGVKCPVAAGAVIEYRERNGDISIEDKPLLLGWMWIHDGSEHDIMAYRICEPVQLPEPEPLSVDELQAVIGKPNGPLNWRDRIHAIDATVEALEEERASLVQLLQGEGLALIERACVATAEDMSDWRNWKVGDLVTVIDSGKWMNKNGSVIQVQAIDGEIDTLPIEAGKIWYYPEMLKFHSRPSA